MFEIAQQVLATGMHVEQEIAAESGGIRLLNVLPYRSSGESRGVVLTLVDVTSLKAAEAEARRLSDIVRDARDAILAQSLDGHIQSWNSGAERLYGYTSGEAVGRHIGLIVPPERTSEIERILEETKQGREVPPFETVRLAKDGSRREVLISVSPIRSESGVVTGASVIALDITARKSAEARAAAAVEQRDKFLAMLSHELRNPLMALVSANELLLHADDSGEIAQRAQQVISRQIKQMSRLLEDTLDASRMRHDRIELQRKLLDLRTVVEAAMDVVKPRATDESIELEVAMPPEPVHVKADATRLQQVIVNLMQNAINHSESGQTVRLRLESDGSDAIVHVADEGDGIEADALPRLFEPFFQASRRSSNGMGLGLSLAQSIVRAHGGQITAASVGLGKGAAFEVRLPQTDEGGDTATDLPALNGGSRRATVLLVDDDDASRESVALLLEKSGYEVLQAANGLDGLRLVEAVMPTVAVIDVGLPDVSGLEIARRVREKHGPNQIRLIALTGFGRQADREAAIEAGCDMHLVKPIDFQTLERVIGYQASR